MTNTFTNNPIKCENCGAEFNYLGAYRIDLGRWVKRGPAIKFCQRKCNKRTSQRKYNKTHTRKLPPGFKNQYEYQKSLPSYERTRTLHTRRTDERARGMAAQYKALSPADKKRLNDIYDLRDELNAQAGCIAYHVDHIHPWAKGGPHHPDNLRVIPAFENLSKGTKLIAA